MYDIKFGTDGWRARIAEEYTFDNVRRATQGFAHYLKHHDLAEKGVVIGYDQRFSSDLFAAAAAEVMAGNGIRVWLTSHNTPTPVISYSVVDREAGGAINITASHNPPADNGFKVRDPQGGAVPPEGLAEIEERNPRHRGSKTHRAQRGGSRGTGQALGSRSGLHRASRHARRSGHTAQRRIQDPGGADVGQRRGLVPPAAGRRHQHRLGNPRRAQPHLPGDAAPGADPAQH